MSKCAVDTQSNVSQNRFGHGGDGKILPPYGIESQSLRPRLVTINIVTDIQTPSNDAAADSVQYNSFI
jgi:hypothetical protein